MEVTEVTGWLVSVSRPASLVAEVTGAESADGEVLDMGCGSAVVPPQELKRSSPTRARVAV